MSNNIKIKKFIDNLISQPNECLNHGNEYVQVNKKDNKYYIVHDIDFNALNHFVNNINKNLRYLLISDLNIDILKRINNHINISEYKKQNNCNIQYTNLNNFKQFNEIITNNEYFDIVFLFISKKCMTYFNNSSVLDLGPCATFISNKFELRPQKKIKIIDNDSYNFKFSNLCVNYIDINNVIDHINKDVIENLNQLVKIQVNTSSDDKSYAGYYSDLIDLVKSMGIKNIILNSLLTTLITSRDAMNNVPTNDNIDYIKSCRQIIIMDIKKCNDILNNLYKIQNNQRDVMRDIIHNFNIINQVLVNICKLQSKKYINIIDCRDLNMSKPIIFRIKQMLEATVMDVMDDNLIDICNHSP